MYCTVGEVLEMIKDDMKNVIIGDEYIEDEQEREAKIATLCESAISDALPRLTGTLPNGTEFPSLRHHRSSTNLQKTYLYTTLYQGQV